MFLLTVRRVLLIFCSRQRDERPVGVQQRAVGIRFDICIHIDIDIGHWCDGSGQQAHVQLQQTDNIVGRDDDDNVDNNVDDDSVVERQADGVIAVLAIDGAERFVIRHCRYSCRLSKSSFEIAGTIPTQSLFGSAPKFAFSTSSSTTTTSTTSPFTFGGGAAAQKPPLVFGAPKSQPSQPSQQQQRQHEPLDQDNEDDAGDEQKK
jgi:hypothetical protein